jgi:hypothetical protein
MLEPAQLEIVFEEMDRTLPVIEAISSDVGIAIRRYSEAVRRSGPLSEGARFYGADLVRELARCRTDLRRDAGRVPGGPDAVDDWIGWLDELRGL